MNNIQTCKTLNSTGNMFRILIDNNQDVDKIVGDLTAHFDLVLTLPNCDSRSSHDGACMGTEVLAVGRTQTGSQGANFFEIDSIFKSIWPEDSDSKGHLVEATTGIEIRESVCGCHEE